MGTRALSFVAALAALTLGATPAHARFGKGGSGGGSSGGGGGAHSSSGGGGRPAPAPQGSYGGYRNHAYGRYYAPYSRPWGGWGYGYAPYGWGYGYGYYASPYYSPYYSGAYAPYTYYQGPPQIEQQRPSPPSPPIRVSVGAEAQGFRGGLSVGGAFSLEGQRWGFATNFSHLSVSADDGSAGTDTINQLNLHLTYAILAGQRGRLRLEGGADTIFAPDLISMGPTVGTSGMLWLFGPLDLEGEVMVTPFPYRQLEWKAGLGLGLGPVGLRAGYRMQVLDDAGLVDGVDHRDVFGGPYVGLALVF